VVRFRLSGSPMHSKWAWLGMTWGIPPHASEFQGERCERVPSIMRREHLGMPRYGLGQSPYRVSPYRGPSPQSNPAVVES
jgi:hypothetical protein